MNESRFGYTVSGSKSPLNVNVKNVILIFKPPLFDGEFDSTIRFHIFCGNPFDPIQVAKPWLTLLIPSSG